MMKKYAQSPLLLRYHHGHGDAVVVVQCRLAGTDDLVFVDVGTQIRANALLAVDTGEIGGIGHIRRGHIDDEGQLLHRQFKTAEHRHRQQDAPLHAQLQFLIP